TGERVITRPPRSGTGPTRARHSCPRAGCSICRSGNASLWRVLTAWPLTLAPLNTSDVTVSAPGRTRWPRHLPGPRLHVPPVSAGAGFGGPPMAIGAEPERPVASQTAWRTAVHDHPGACLLQPRPVHLCRKVMRPRVRSYGDTARVTRSPASTHQDRKSTRLNSSHGSISYAVFCLKTKKKQHKPYSK